MINAAKYLICVVFVSKHPITRRLGATLDTAPPLTSENIVNQKLQNVTRTLHDLIKALPAVKAHCNAEVLKRHLQLIAHFQQQYDQLVMSKQQPDPA